MESNRIAVASANREVYSGISWKTCCHHRATCVCSAFGFVEFEESFVEKNHNIQFLWCSSKVLYSLHIPFDRSVWFLFFFLSLARSLATPHTSHRTAESKHRSCHFILNWMHTPRWVARLLMNFILTSGKNTSILIKIVRSMETCFCIWFSIKIFFGVLREVHTNGICHNRQYTERERWDEMQR